MKRLQSLLAAAALASVAGAQAPATGAAQAALQQARTHLAAGRFAQADSILGGIVAQAPENMQAWLALGNARKGLGRVDDAIAAFLRVTVPQLRPQALQGLFLTYAGAKRFNEAAPLLDSLRAFNTPDFSQLVIQPEVASLKPDSRFALLFPDATTFARPFVENVRIIHEWRGEERGDEFGWIARSIGDVDEDGVEDAVVSATQTPPLGTGAGKVYVYSGKSGRLLWKREGPANARLGVSVEAAGDVNRDGIPDVAAGAPGVNSVFVYSGRDGAELMRIRGDSADGDFGASAAGIGDFNGDGHADIIGGATTAPAAGARTGRVHIISGKDGRRLLTINGRRANDAFGSSVAGGAGFFVVGASGGGPNSRGQMYVYNRLDTVPAFVRDADETGVQFAGMFTTVIGDVDRDGVADVYASDYPNTAKGPATGRVYVFSGKSGAPLQTITGEGGGFGSSASRAGDVDGDGAADLVVGAWQWRGAAWSGGRIQVFSGRDGRLLRTITGRVPGETLGFDAVGIGDVDGDGTIDLLITSAYSLVNGPRSGRVFIVSGR